MTRRFLGGPLRHILLPVFLVALAASSQFQCGLRRSSTTASTQGVCGDGVLDLDEDCDDGNTLDSDGCSSRCIGPLHWVAADPHVHDDGCDLDDYSLERLLPAARSAELKIVSILLWQGHLGDRASDLTGFDHSASTPELILHRDVEVSGLPASQTGHLMLLGLSPPLDPVLWTAHSSVAIVERMRLRRPEILIGMAHAGWPDPDGLVFPAPPGAGVELPVLAARSELDFIAFEVEVPKQTEYMAWIPLSNWRRLQNSGYRLPLLGGSDYPCGNQVPGNTRSYVLLDGTPTYRKYLDAIRQGRVTMALDGDDLLDLRVGMARVGDEVNVVNPRVRLRIESNLSAKDDVRVIVNGETAGKLSVPSGPQVRPFELTLETSAWIHLRSSRAITNPIYVLLDSAPIPRRTADLCYFIDWIDRIQSEADLELKSDRALALAAYEQARGVFVDRLPGKSVTECDP